MNPNGPEVRHPFEGKPLTREVTDENGNVRFEVTAAVLTPLRARIADEFALWTAAAVAALLILYVMNHNPTLPTLLFAASAWFLHPLFKLAWRQSLRHSVHLVITEEEFRFRGWAGWRSFDRKLQHRFALILHDKARRERERHELEERKAQQRKKIIKKRRYYQDSYHLAFEYIGQRNDVATIYGRPEAQAVLARLKGVDEVMTAHANRGGGTPLRPQQEWVEQPGAIPETPDR
jgi:hypothetical protein